MAAPRALPLALLLLAVAPLPARAAVARTVCAGGCAFTSIQAAHDASLAGDTLDVRGTITEAGIALTKNLVILSTLSTPQIVQAATRPAVAGDRVFFVSPGITVRMTNLIIRNGVWSGGGGGGGIANLGSLILTRVRVEDNQTTALGGGIFTQGAGASLVLTESTIQYNHANVGGGGIYAENTNVTIDRSTLAANVSFEGGALNSNFATVLVTNSTVSMNRANNGGGGTFNQGGGTLTAESCTFSQNSLRAIQCNGAGSVLKVRNCIIANSLTSSYLPGGADCAVFLGGVITDQGHNLVESPGGVSFTGTGSTTGVDPALSALADFGGPTRTHALLITSAALHSGSTSLLTDQRNTSRPQIGVADRGAFEYRAIGEPLRPTVFSAPVVANGTIYVAEFSAFDVRGLNFAVQIQGAGGAFSNFTPDFFHHGTFVGAVHGVPGAITGATYFPLTGESYYHVIFEDGTEWSNEGGATTIRTGSPATKWPQLVPDPGGSGSILWGAEVGVDIPNARYVGSHASNPNDALGMIEHSVMAANLVYIQQVRILHSLGRVILRGDAAADPYATKVTHGNFLAAVADQWTNVLPPSTHDLALVIRPLNGEAGLASVGSAANPAGYSSNDATARGDFSRVWRHEAGHNWFLSHFDGGAPEGPSINSANDLGRFSGPEQALVEWYRGTRTAQLDNLGPFPDSVPPRAATDRMIVPRSASSVLINVLANDHDANGDALTLLSIDAASASTLGGSMAMTLSPGVVRYTPPPPAGPTSEIDRFSYRIRDSRDQEALGYVYVRLADFNPGLAFAQPFSLPDGVPSFTDGSYLSNISEKAKVTVLGQALQLTEDSTFHYSGYTLPVMNMHRGFTASFRYRLTAAGIPADGFAFNFGQPNATRIQASGTIAGYTRGVTVEWRTYSHKGISVRVHGVELPGGFLAMTGLVDGVWHAVEIEWYPGTGLTLKIDGSPKFTNLATPGFIAHSEDMISFAAFTGALSEQTLLDDIELAPVPVTAVPGDGLVPQRFALRPNSPNPFAVQTQVRFDLPRAGTAELSIHDLQGRLIRRIAAGETLPAGQHKIAWDGTDDRGSLVPNGVYLYRIHAGEFTATRRMILVR